MDGYACALRFDTNASEFVRGVEVGRLWEIVNRSDEAVEEFVHASNAEMVLRIAEATGRVARSEELDGGWLLVTFETA
ncbi:MAG: hypothetical protein QOH76_2091 [Thermoleophilaceae bacterium]|jgi:hypothetical protein|nr:hypothetical protein [Thermoleophilaceae bacterium]